MFAKPQAEHDWLQQLVGEWTSEMTGCGAPGEAAETSAGTETVRSLGGVWTVGEGTGTMPDGAPAKTLMTLGYDPQKGRYVGTFVGSMMTHLWVYEGSLSDDGRSLVLETEGPAMTADGMARYRDIVTIVGPDERRMTSRILGADGEWTEFMQATYRRVR